MMDDCELRVERERDYTLNESNVIVFLDYPA